MGLKDVKFVPTKTEEETLSEKVAKKQQAAGGSILNRVSVETYTDKFIPVIVPKGSEHDISPANEDWSDEQKQSHEERLAKYGFDRSANEKLFGGTMEQLDPKLAAQLRNIQASASQHMKRLKVAHVGCKKYLSFFTRYFFKYQYNKKFIVSEHHKAIWGVLDRVLKGELTKVIINVPPRYGKTEIAVKNFIAHGLAINPSSKFIHLSYSKTLALDNSEAVKDIVKHEEFKKLYPDVQIKPKSDSKEKWYTTAGGGVYATATGGQVTGFGAGEVDEEAEEVLEFDENGKEISRRLSDDELGEGSDGIFEGIPDDFLDGLESQLADSFIGEKSNFCGALIIDDPMKPEDADSELRRTRINERFDSTIRNRVNSRKTPIIVIMQRLHEDDLCGHLIKEEGLLQDGGDWFVLSLPAIVDEGLPTEHALWEHKHDLAELKKQRKNNATVFERQMMQNPMPKEGLMYDTFKTYKELPLTIRSIQKAYIDTADQGKDFLAGLIYMECNEGMFVTDIIYTDEGMETTEPLTAKALTFEKVQVCRIEYNNGGHGFKRAVELKTRSVLKNFKIKFVGFTQTNNKAVRIFQNSFMVTNMIYMPYGWEKRWPKFYKDVTQYAKAGGNAHDDAPDALTGMCEFFGKDNKLMDNSWASGMQ